MTEHPPCNACHHRAGSHIGFSSGRHQCVVDGCDCNGYVDERADRIKRAPRVDIPDGYAGQRIRINVPAAAVPSLDALLRKERELERDAVVSWLHMLDDGTPREDQVLSYGDLAEGVRAGRHLEHGSKP